MSNIIDILRYIKKRDKGGDTLIKGNTYTSEQIKFAHQLLSDAAKEFDEARKKPRLSRRRAFIVILEELYYDVPEYPKNVKLEDLQRRANTRFEIVYRGSKSPQTIQDIHPKNPCAFFENDGHRKARYRNALSHLVEYGELYFQIEDAAISLGHTYEEILLC